MSSVIIVLPRLFQQSTVKVSAAKDFFPPVFPCDSGKPQGSLLFGLLLPWEEFSQKVLIIEIVLGYDTDSAGFKMPLATQWSCLSQPAGRRHLSHMEIAKLGNGAAGSEATSFPCRVQHLWNINNPWQQTKQYLNIFCQFPFLLF